MMIKVCGIKYESNYRDIVGLDIDMIGINFYQPSVRYIGAHNLPVVDDVSRVGVFVNASIDEIKDAVHTHALDYIQLHGDEDISFCKSAQMIKPIIKVWRVSDTMDWSQIEEFGFVDMFLFDTQTKKYGGSGKKFNWSLLSEYKDKVPFMLSGGIGPSDAALIKEVDHPMLIGIDINSKFESEPARKNTFQIESFINTLTGE
jgi:Phosphoribosylanthranilate isomerase